MESRLREMELRIEALEAAVFAAEDRVATPAPSDTSPVVAAETSPPDDTAAAGRPRLHFASLIGRLFMGMAGAFLLRAAVDDGLLPPTAGFALGLAYAAGWLLLANRCHGVVGSRRGLVHGMLAALIAYPLLGESGAAKQLVSPVVALASTGAITVGFLIVAGRLNRQILALSAVFGAAAVGTSLYWSSEAKAAACLTLIAVSVMSYMTGHRRSWQAPRWIAASWANIILFLPLLHASGSPDRLEGGYPTATLVLLLAVGQFVVFVGLFSRSMLFRRRPLGAFEILQTFATMVLAFGSALVMARIESAYAIGIGFSALLTGAALYAFSFFKVQDSFGKGAEFYYHSTLAVLLVLTGAAFLPSGGYVGALWMGMALLMAIPGARRSRLTLRYHGAAVTLSAMLATGMLMAAHPPLTSTVVAPLLEPDRLVVMGLVFVCGWVLASTPLPHDAAWTRRLPTALVFGASALLGTGLLAQVAALITGGGQVLDPGVTAVIRTLAGCATAILLMAMVRLLRRPEPAWLVMPLLFALGFKVIFEDLNVGSSGLRFVGFLAYGATWIAAARTVRFSRTAADNAVSALDSEGD